MSHHKNHPNGKDQHGHDRGGAAHQRATGKKLIHHDWRFWTALALMLLAMAAYVVTNDESLLPGGEEQPVVPEAAE